MKTNAEGRKLIALFKEEYEAEISRTQAEKALTLLVRRRLTSNQFSALVSLVMSIGLEEFKASKMLRLLNTVSLHSALQAADEFDLYIYDGRKPDPFLIRQREMEKALFLMPEVVGGRI